MVDNVLVGEMKMEVGRRSLDFAPTKWQLLCVRRGVHTHSVSHAHFSDTFSLRGVQTSRTRTARGVCSAHVISLHLTLSILMETTFLSAQSLPDFTRSESAGQAHFRTSGGEFGCLADPTHSTGFEPKEFDKITSADGATTPINDPNYDNISDFSKREHWTARCFHNVRSPCFARFSW